jgi:hypothetical protein
LLTTKETEGLGHRYFLSENSATPSQLGDVTVIQVSDSQTADWQFSPPTLGVGVSSPKYSPRKKPVQKDGVFRGGSYRTRTYDLLCVKQLL